jgi:hypothetical protein
MGSVTGRSLGGFIWCVNSRVGKGCDAGVCDGGGCARAAHDYGYDVHMCTMLV